MKNTFVYYLWAIIIPAIILFIVSLNKNSLLFSLALALFVLYRYIIDTKRLADLGIIKKGSKEYYYPLKSIVYFKELYTGK